MKAHKCNVLGEIIQSIIAIASLSPGIYKP